MEKNELPENWIIDSFTDVFDIGGGTQPPKSEFISEPMSGYIRLLQIRDFGNKPVPTYIPFTKKLRTCKEDDFLIARYGASIGRIVTGMKGAYNVALAKVKIPKPINKRYVGQLLKSNIFQNPILQLQRTAQNGFNKNDLAQILIPLPPRPEQDRIVAKVDILMAQVESMQKSLARIPQLLKDFRQQVLTQAVTGKLTEEWRVDKSLLPVKLNEESNLTEISVFKYPKELKEWKITALGNFASVARGKFSARPRNDPKYFSGPYRFSQIGDLPREGGYYEAFSSTLNEEGRKVSKSFPKNTVLVAIVGATIGNSGMNSVEMYFPDSIIGINSNNRMSNQFIEYHLRVSKYKFREIASASGGQPNIKIPTLKTLEIGVPPIEEQQEIVRRVESLFFKADAIEAHYQTLKSRIDTLPPAILHKAFKGELVAQLPSDGDARDLLREIERLKRK